MADSNKIIDKVLNNFKSKHSKIAVLLVVCLQRNHEAEEDIYQIFSSYCSDSELDELVNAFKTFVDYIDVSFDEKEFIKKLNNNTFDKLIAFNRIVYTGTATGTARSKSALIPALCDIYGLPYCSNDIFTAALLDNKMAAYGLLKSVNSPMPPTWFYSSKQGWLGEIAPTDVKLIAKPAYGCASSWITKKSVSYFSPEFLQLIHNTSIFANQPVMIQEFIEGYEVEVPVFDLEKPFAPLAVGISREGDKSMGGEFFTYDEILGDKFELFNFAEEDFTLAEELRITSENAYKLLQLKGPVRFDYRVDQITRDIYLMDFNNSPHLGKKHSFAFSIQSLGYEYIDMLKMVLYSAKKNYEEVQI